eukprot:Partr_v1_DN26525_c2_g1_i4_m3669 putative beta' subunit
MELAVDRHVEFIRTLEQKRHELEYWMSEHLRLSGVYWGYTCLHLLGRSSALDAREIARYVLSCQSSVDVLTLRMIVLPRFIVLTCRSQGGFGGHVGYDSHLLYTLSAIQLLVTCRHSGIDVDFDVDRVVTYISGLQKADGSFAGDEWGEIDTRFSYCALSCLSILGRLDAVDVGKAASFICACQNFDGGFGSVPGAESHAGQIFCCVGALAIVDRLDMVDRNLLSQWLVDRQLSSGGLNGRPEKLADVCYSWWVLASLSIVDRVDGIDTGALTKFILESQDEESGGIADRPGDVSDVFHTLFGVAGLSLVGYPGLEAVDPVYCMPSSITRKFSK